MVLIQDINIRKSRQLSNYNEQCNGRGKNNNGTREHTVGNF